MRKDNPNVQYFKTETDVSNQNLIDDFFKKFERPFHRKVIKWKKNGVTRLLSQKTETLYAEPNKCGSSHQ